VSVEDDVCFWGDDVSLFPHVAKFLKLNGVHAWVRIASAPIAFSPEALADRKIAAVEAREAILTLAGPGFYPEPAVEPEMAAK
jgi:hypothetical protein